eukprot:Skav216589  [mRNA]  locus=scaffold3151:240682:241277:- [translate_table: standard]
MNCIELMAPKKKTVGTTNAWTASHLKVKMGYATGVLATAAGADSSALRATRLRVTAPMAGRRWHPRPKRSQSLTGWTPQQSLLSSLVQLHVAWC